MVEEMKFFLVSPIGLMRLMGFMRLRGELFYINKFEFA